VAGCLAALAAQTRPPDDVVILDNASSDDGVEIARRSMPDARVERSTVNLGFAAGQNRAIALAPADVHVVLNPDCRLGPTFLARAEEVLASDRSTGSVSGRLLRFRPDEPDGGVFDDDGPDVIDSTGMVGLRNRRVLDRGADEPAAGRFLEPGYVFGVTGAAGVYRRAMLDDVAFEAEILDEAFFAYREDVDLAWRAQLLGWRCRYEPAMLARHRRRVAPGRRRQLPARVNRWSVANRWRMLAKNEIGLGWRRDGSAILRRDAQILGYCLLREQRTLGAILDVLGDAGRLRERRRDLMRRRVASDEEMVAWFGRVEQLPLGEAGPPLPRPGRIGLGP
jgi:GT2 family glycosyltransferase